MTVDKDAAADKAGTDKIIATRALHLDSRNPRHDPIENEPEIIQALYSKGVPHLGRHIAEHGLNPLTRVGVTRHPKLKNHFVALEGNRRLCALKLLNDPQKAPTPAARRAFEQIRENAKQVPERIKVVVFDERPIADPWLAVTHEGEQKGVGVVPWGPGEKARFNERSGGAPNPNRQALELRDYASARGLISEEQAAEIALTTLTRYLSNQLVRDALGLVNGTDMTIDTTPQEFETVLKKFLLDALPSPDDPNGKARLSSRSDVGARKAYAHSLREDGYAPTTRNAVPTKLEVPKSGEAASAKTSTASRSVRDRNLRPHVIPPDFKLQHKDDVLGQLVRENKRHTVKTNPMSCNYLTRAIIERVAYLYANRHNLGAAGKTHVVLGRCLDHLVTTGAAKETQLKSLRVVAQTEHDAGSIHTLGTGVHGGRIPIPSELKTNWTNIQPGLELLIAGAM